MKPVDAALPDKCQVRRSFARAAADYDAYADLQRRSGAWLLDRLDLTPEQVRLVVDVGSGTGYGLPALAQRFPAATLISLDLAEAMLHRGRTRWSQGRFVCADAEALPLADACADVIYANLALQWCGSLQRPLAEFARVLQPGGTAVFSLFASATLKELREAWQTVDAQRRVNDFIAIADVREALAQAGFNAVDSPPSFRHGLAESRDRDVDASLMSMDPGDPLTLVATTLGNSPDHKPQTEIQQRCEVLEYASVRELMRELKGLGAHNVMVGRPRHMTGKSALARMEAAYREQMAGGPIRATYEIISVVVRKP